MTRWPHFDDEQVQALDRVLRSGNVNDWTGQEWRLFEQEFAGVCSRRYAVALADGNAAHVGSTYCEYHALVRPGRLQRGWHRDRLMAEIAAAGVPCFSGVCSEISLEKTFERYGSRPAEQLPVARQLGETSLVLLVDPTLADEDTLRTCRVIEGVADARRKSAPRPPWRSGLSIRNTGEDQH